MKHYQLDGSNYDYPRDLIINTCVDNQDTRKNKKKKGGLGVLLTDLTSPQFCACPKSISVIPTSHVVVFFVLRVQIGLFALLILVGFLCLTSLFKLFFITVDTSW